MLGVKAPINNHTIMLETGALLREFLDEVFYDGECENTQDSLGFSKGHFAIHAIALSTPFTIRIMKPCVIGI
jgi:hypothetical protein